MRTITADLTHFLTEKGTLPDDIPDEAKQLVEFLGSIVAAVTGGQYTEFPKTNVCCIQTEKGKVCDACVQAGFDEENDDGTVISWDCPKCKSSGVIRGWEKTVWNLEDAVFNGGKTQ